MARPDAAEQPFPQPESRPAHHGESSGSYQAPPSAWQDRRSRPDRRNWRNSPRSQIRRRGQISLRRPTWASSALQGLLALAVYATVWLPTAARPLISHPSWAQLLQSSPDPNFYVWCLRWWPYAFVHGLNPMYTNLIAAPAGHSLAWVTTVPPLALVAAPLTLTAGPVVAFNLLTALSLPVSGWAAFLACRRLTGTFWPSLVGGAVYGFSAFELSHVGAGQINMCYALLPPLLVCMILSWRDGSIGRLGFVVLAALVLALQFYLFLETFADVTAILVVSLALGLALARRDGRRRLVQLAELLGIAYLIALALAAPYLADALSSAAPKVPKHRSMDLASLVLPRLGRTLGTGWLSRAEAHINPASAGCSVGIPLLAVLIALAATRWRSRLVWFLTGLFVILIVAALGPIVHVSGKHGVTMPWQGLFGLPFVRNAYPSRLMLFAFLILALAAALLLSGASGDGQPQPPAGGPPGSAGSWQARWSLAGRWSLAVLVVAFGVLNATGPRRVEPHTTVPAFVSGGEYQREFAPGEIVMVVSKVGNAGMLWQAESGSYWRLAGGFINDGFEHRTDLPPPATKLKRATPGRVDRAEGLIRTDHIGAVVVDAHHAPRWAGVFGIFGLTGHRSGGVVVYLTHGCQACHGVTRAEIKAATFPSRNNSGNVAPRHRGRPALLSRPGSTP